MSFSRKLYWAGKRIEDLRQTTELWLGTDAYRFVPDTNPQTSRTVVRAKIRKPPAPELALIIGDIAHLLRVTLDHLALELAVTNNRPQTLAPKVVERSEFVIIGNSDKARGAHQFDSAAGSKLQGIDAKVRQAIKDIQPYHREAAYIEHPLWVIHELDRIDKHRRLNLTAYAFGGIGIGNGYVGQLHFEKAGHRGPVENDTEVATFTVFNSNFQMNFTREIAIAEPSLWSDPVIAMEKLVSLHDFIRDEVLRLLVPFL